MKTSNTIKIALCSTMFLWQSVAYSAPPHLPELAAPGTKVGMTWTVRMFQDRSPEHAPAAKFDICFTNPGIAAGTHDSYTWYATSHQLFGTASMEGNEVHMFGRLNQSEPISIGWRLAGPGYKRPKDSIGTGSMIYASDARSSNFYLFNVELRSSGERCKPYSQTNLPTKSKSPFAKGIGLSNKIVPK